VDDLTVSHRQYPVSVPAVYCQPSPSSEVAFPHSGAAFPQDWDAADSADSADGATTYVRTFEWGRC
jgi:hypothetical protein